jgi:mRNA interferase RelE/StbE
VYKVEFSKTAAKELESVRKRDRALYVRFSVAIEAIARDPFQGKSLRVPFLGDRSFRVGSYRILYTIYKERLLVYVFDFGHRREIYR